LSGIRFSAAIPKGYEPPEELVARARSLARRHGAKISIEGDPETAVAGADCVVTDTFVSMGFDSERKKREKAFIPKFRVNASLMSRAKKGAIFEHCLPAHRGEEVDTDVIDGPQSVVFDEAENRLHTAKALLCFLMLPRADLARLIPS